MQDTDDDQQNWDAFWGGQKQTSWPDLEQEFRVVILAEAGAGKTFEMTRQARRVAASGRAAFFIRIEDIDESFETAFEVGSAADFATWLGSGAPAWFFLDSVDEARLESPRAFEKAIRRFSARIGAACERAHIFISSRPYAWRARTDAALLETCLPVQTAARPEGQADPQSALKVYRLDPLSERDIRLFAAHRSIPEIDRLITDLHRANLLSMAARPFDLEGILVKWRVDRTLEGRLELLRHNIAAGLEEMHPDRSLRRPLSRDQSLAGARVLAAAVVLTGEPGIRVPDAGVAQRGMDAAQVLGDWDPLDIQALLERGVFNDVLYGMVRFRHREVQELLAAEWFAQMLRKRGARHAIEALFVREQDGHWIITPRLRPVLPWLVLFDAGLRQRVLAIVPDIAIEGGDAAQLPLPERQVLLSRLVERLTGEEADRAHYDNGAVARIAQPDLQGDTLRLIETHRAHDEALFFLGRLAWQGEMAGCVPALMAVAADAGRGLYARMAALRAVMACGDRSQQDCLWAKLNTHPSVLPRRLLAEILEQAAPDAASVGRLLASIDKLEPHSRYQAAGLDRAFHRFIDRVQDARTADRLALLVTLACGLDGFLGRVPYLDRRDCEVSQAFVWLVGPATHVVEQLVLTRAPEVVYAAVLSLLCRLGRVQDWGVGEFKAYQHRLHDLVPAWPVLNDAFFWYCVEARRAQRDDKGAVREVAALADVRWLGMYWAFGADRFEDVVGWIQTRVARDDKRLALSLGCFLWMRAGRPEAGVRRLQQAVAGDPDLEPQLAAFLDPAEWQREQDWQAQEAHREKRRSQRETARQQRRARWVEGLRSSPDMIRHPPGLAPGECSVDQYALFEAAREGDHWQALIPEFGEAVAHAYRDAAVAAWRHHTPGLRSEGHNTASIPGQLLFAVAGLQIEAHAEGFFETLSGTEIAQVVRYVFWIWRGLPDWLEACYRADPDGVLAVMLPEFLWELSQVQADQPLHYIVRSLTHGAPWMHASLAPGVLAWLQQHDTLNVDVLHDCLYILLSGGIEAAALAQLSRSKVVHPVLLDGQLAIWYALWVDVEAAQAIPALEQHLLRLPPAEASEAAQRFITTLQGTHRSLRCWPGRGDFRGADHLLALYLLMHRHIPVKDDIDRANQGVYSPSLRDHAQSGREALLQQLIEMPGGAAQRALSRLAQCHPDVSLRPWVARKAYQHVEREGDLEPWSASQVREFGQSSMRTPETHRQLFDLVVQQLIDLKTWLECGNDSPYQTWQKVDDENELRNLVAGWLNQQSPGSYSCAQENELSNGQRPDLWVQAGAAIAPVPVELKLLDQGWSGPALCERLRNQLAGDYLREPAGGCGVMLLAWRGKTDKAHWEINGQSVSRQAVAAALEAYWHRVSDVFPNVAVIKVLMIDLTMREGKSSE